MWDGMSKPLLEVTRLSIAYQRVQAVSGVDVAVEPGQLVALLGGNGAGKTSLLRAISGLVRPESGSVHMLGRAITGLPADKVARLGVAHVPEGRHVFGGLSVLDNLRLGSSSRRATKAELADDLERVFELFPDLRTRQKVLGWTLSGGQQQMVAVGRALMARPQLLLLDEPSLGLAPVVVKEIFRAIGRLRDLGTTILLVEQNTEIALKLADYAYVMETGRVVLEGRAGDLSGDPRIVGAYLGSDDGVTELASLPN